MLSSRALIVDYNGTFVPGYEEIGLAYAFLAKAVKDRRFGRALKLVGPLQARCWYLTLAHRLDEVGKVFAEQVLPGEDPEYIQEVLSRPDSILYRIARNPPKIGKKIDTKPIPLAAYVVEQAKKRGRKTGVYTASFQEIVEASLRRYGKLGLFDFVYGNPFIVGKGKITGIEERVNFFDKAEGFEDFLELQGLPRDGSGVVYVGDSDPDKGVFGKVEDAVVAPTAREDFRKKVHSEFSGQGRMHLPKNWEGVARLLSD